MLKLYGIKNCDTVKRARKWLDENGYDYEFHDFRSDGLNSELLDLFVEKIGWEKMLNRRGTTWRKLPEADRENLYEAKAKRLMLEQPTLIKRPVVDYDQRFTVGFDTNFFREPT